jgi:ABC-2 type transport system ATP-binding protein
LITSIAKEKTILLSTHIMQEVKAICNRIIIIKSGVIVANDSTDNIQQGLDTNAQVILVEFSAEPNTRDLLSIPGVVNAKKIKDLHWVIEATTDKDIRQDVFNFAVEKGYSILSMQRKEKSLEEVFQEFTKN